MKPVMIAVTHKELLAKKQYYVAHEDKEFKA